MFILLVRIGGDLGIRGDRVLWFVLLLCNISIIGVIVIRWLWLMRIMGILFCEGVFSRIVTIFWL